MKIKAFEPDTKGGYTDKLIAEFEVNEILYPQRKKLNMLNEKRFPMKVSVDPKTKKPIIDNIGVDRDAFVDFYIKVFELSGLKDSDIIKYGELFSDAILEQIYDAWNVTEKK